MATETAFVEWVEGKPYSNAADPDIVIRCRGGESGRGRHNRSLMKPLKKTPVANICTMLFSRQCILLHLETVSKPTPDPN